MIYITGDTHGDFSRLHDFCRQHQTSAEKDIMIILGDVALNYDEGIGDMLRKWEAEQCNITFFCIHGNHEQRPSNIPAYKTKEFHGGIVWYEKEHPTLLFAKDGEIYDLGGYECIVIGGAYSVDKKWRLARGDRWFEDEQPSDEIKQYVESQLAKRQNKIDIVLSHTCPLDYQPIDVFLSGIDQSKVDSSTEEWLNKIEHGLEYKKWYCGHYHINRTTHKLRFLFGDIEEFGV